MKKSKSKLAIRIVVIAAVIIIPLLYSYLYLGAFWDPYSRLETLPVAVVNNDAGAEINDEQRNLGQELCDKLSEEAELKFIFTDEADAKAGTEGDKYYAMIVVPKEFSADIASASTTDKKAATITFSANEKRNFLASQILSRAVLQIEESLRDNVNSELVGQLADTINEVPDQMTELQDGLGELQDGGNKLTDGTADLADGASKLADGASDLTDGTKTLADGASDLADGTKTLAKGTATFQDKFTQYQSGVSKLSDGSGTLATGATSLNTGIDALLNGANTLATSTQNIDQLSSGAKTLAAGAQALNAGLIQYTQGVDALITSVNTTTTFLKQYATQVNPSIMKDPVFAGFMTKLATSANADSIKTLQAASTQLTTASQQISAGATALSTGCDSLPKLKAAISTLAGGLEQAKEGSTKLSQGAQTLSAGLATVNDATSKLSKASSDIASGAAKVNDGATALSDGATKLKDGSVELNDGATKLSDGANDLNDGAVKLNDGITTAKDGVDDAITDTNEQLDKLDGLAEFAKAPVTVETNNINTVPNYGTAFAPYFLSLSLWVGALIMFVGIYLDQEGKFQIMTCNSTHRLARSFLYLVLGFAQALVLAVALEYGLGLDVANRPLYYASCCLVSLVSISIVQFLMVHLKDAGKFLSIVLLILQLTSCGGTFPMETIPKFFSVLYPYMPMTYAVGLFKQSISGVTKSDAIYNASVLIVIIIVFTALTIILSGIKAKKAAIVESREVKIAM